MNSLKIHAACLTLLLTTILVSGCGGGLNEVTGKVTLDGKPVKGLEVTFTPKDPTIGTTAIGYTQADGTYKLHYPGDKTGAPAGEYIVTISGSETDGEGPPIRVAPQADLVRTIESGPNNFDFEVTSK